MGVVIEICIKYPRGELELKSLTYVCVLPATHVVCVLHARIRHCTGTAYSTH
jgi:hypothetical protein